MPRLLFSSLPADVTTAHLTEILSNPPKGISPPSFLDFTNPRPTDVKVLLSQLGRSRRMAFVGYKSEQQASWIKDVWQGVWIEGRSSAGSGSRISVEWAKSVEDCAKTHRLPQPNDSKPSSNILPPKKKLKIDGPLQKSQDPQFVEFMTLSNPRKSKSLVHEITGLSVPHHPQEPPHALPHEGTLIDSHQKEQVITTERQETEELELSSLPPVIGDEDDLNDKEYLARRMKREIINPEERLPEKEQVLSESKEWDQDPTEPVIQNPPNDRRAGSSDEISKKPSVPSDEACILESSRLFLRNLAFSLTEEELQELFEPFGTIAQVHILLDNERKPKGLGYVTFNKASDALEAYRQLDQTDFQGRLLHILPAVTRNPRGKSSESTKGHNSVKQEKDSKRRLESSKQFNWATLYMNADAVASSVADRLNITKSELFDPEAQNPAVKLALAETHVINETKQYLENNGINIEAFEKIKSARSDTTLLVKNVPYKTSVNVIKALFADHGTVIKVLMPPAGTIAVVEMANKDDAKSAFRGLSYKRIGNSVLYLEKAPQDLWQVRSDSTKDEAQVQTKDDSEAKLSKDEETGEPGSTLFIKNIAFGTTPETLASRFSNLSGYLFSRIRTKPDPKNPAKRLSMGFGFVGFRTVELAKQAIQKMQGCYLDGHTLELKFSKRGREDEEEEGATKSSSNNSKGSTNKLLVKNLPFEVNKKELYELFGVYGKLKSIRLPKKIDRKTRGFGFIEYHTKKEAQEALNSLKFSHLLGRHLVIEFAHEANSTLDLDKLRNTQSSFLNLHPTHQKKKFVGLKNKDDDQDDMSALED